ncbi:MAG: primosomal protein N', partial [Sediminibacterium sp.]|nr:primosomal protein N' [Sediminibacterium sp.]
DFRVNERAFQLIEQVSGRAGRRLGQGKVMIQMRQVNHSVIHYALSHNFHELYKNETLLRKEFGYPPYSRLIQISAKHVKEEVAIQLIKELYRSMSNYSKYIQGPSQPVISRIRNQFIYEIWFKLPRNTQIIQKCKHDIQHAIQLILQKKELRGGYFQCNVDPF